VVLNEQNRDRRRHDDLSLTVNAIHITVSGAVLQGVTGTVDLDSSSPVARDAQLPRRPAASEPRHS